MALFLFRHSEERRIHVSETLDASFVSMTERQNSENTHNFFHMDQSIFFGFLLATALGALIGTEREMPWSGTRPG